MQMQVKGIAQSGCSVNQVLFPLPYLCFDLWYEVLINYASEIFPLHESDNSQTLRAKIHRQANQKMLERYLLDSDSLWGMG